MPSHLVRQELVPMPFFRVILLICGLVLGWTAVRAEPSWLPVVEHIIHTSG